MRVVRQKNSTGNDHIERKCLSFKTGKCYLKRIVVSGMGYENTANWGCWSRRAVCGDANGIPQRCASALLSWPTCDSSAHFYASKDGEGTHLFEITVCTEAPFPHCLTFLSAAVFTLVCMIPIIPNVGIHREKQWCLESAFKIFSVSPRAMCSWTCFLS